MEYLLNQIKAGAGALDGHVGGARFGLVSSFDSEAYSARVLIQPENVLTGWLPVLSPWVGAGWGLAAPLVPGAQVLVLAQEGNAEQGVVLGAIWSAVDQPVPAPAGELWLQHQSGSFLKFREDGTIILQALQVNIMGNLVVSGDISDLNSAHGTIANLRQAYDEHAHTVPQGGSTGLPSDIV